MLNNLKLRLSLLIFFLLGIAMIAVALVGYAFLLHSVKKIELSHLVSDMEAAATKFNSAIGIGSYLTNELTTAYFKKYNIDCYALYHNGYAVWERKKCSISQKQKAQLNSLMESGKSSIALEDGVLESLSSDQPFAVVASTRGKDDSDIGILVTGRLHAGQHIYENIFGITAVYIIVNAVILTIVGFFRLIKIVVKPLENLVELANSYEDHSIVDDFMQQDQSEFGQLAFRLGQLIKRVERDNLALKSSVESLTQSNEQLQKAREEIVRAEKLATVGRLSAGLAHEVGNPLAIVKGYLDILEGDAELKNEDRQFVVRAGEEVSRIESIISQLLDFSRQSKKTIIEVNLVDVVDDLISMFESRHLSNNIRFIKKCNSQNMIVMADYDSLRQVFLNCLLNSVDAINESKNINSGIITISLSTYTSSTDRLMATIEITDNGVGVKEENFLNVFDPFFSTKEPGKGTGLGLAVTYSIVEQYGGSIFFEKNRPDGTCLRVELPCISDGAIGN